MACPSSFVEYLFAFWGRELFGTCVVPLGNGLVCWHAAVTKPRSSRCPAPLPLSLLSLAPCLILPLPFLLICEQPGSGKTGGSWISPAHAWVYPRAAGTEHHGRARASLLPGMGHLGGVCVCVCHHPRVFPDVQEVFLLSSLGNHVNW